MLDVMRQSSLKQTLFTAFVMLVFGTSAIEITWEFADGETLITMWDDLLWFAVSAVLLTIFIVERQAQSAELKELRGQLHSGRGKLSQLDSETPRPH